MHKAMLDQRKIPIFTARQAYGLNVHEVNDLIQALCPNAVFPLALWHQAYERFWKDFARGAAIRAKVECPVLPDLVLEPGKYFYTDLCGFDVMAFFRELSLLIDSKIAKMGLEYILAETFDTFDTVYPEERAFLFSTLQKLEQRGPGYNMFDIENIEDELLCLPASSYHFISYTFLDTILVDTVVVIQQLRNCPFLKEGKGITHALVKSVLDALAKETESTSIAPSQPQVQATKPHSTGSKKDTDRIQATRQACEEAAKELLLEKQVFANNKKHWQQNLLFDNGKTNWKTFIGNVEARLASKAHYETAREAWKQVPSSLKHNGRMREQ